MFWTQRKSLPEVELPHRGTGCFMLRVPSASHTPWAAELGPSKAQPQRGTEKGGEARGGREGGGAEGGARWEEGGVLKAGAMPELPPKERVAKSQRRGPRDAREPGQKPLAGSGVTGGTWESHQLCFSAIGEESAAGAQGASLRQAGRAPSRVRRRGGGGWRRGRPCGTGTGTGTAWAAWDPQGGREAGRRLAEPKTRRRQKASQRKKGH